MCYVARSLPDEWKQSPVEKELKAMEGTSLEGLVITGNRDYRSYGGRFLTILKDWERNVDNICDIVSDNQVSKAEKEEEIRSLFPRWRETICPDKLVRVLDRYGNSYQYAEVRNCDVLTAVTGVEYDYRQLTGAVQGEWNYLYYPIGSWDRDKLERFNTKYWNMGSEWIVQEVDDDSDEEESDDDGFTFLKSVYCTDSDEEKIRKNICESVGCRPDELIMYRFTGFSHIPTYSRI